MANPISEQPSRFLSSPPQTDAGQKTISISAGEERSFSYYCHKLFIENRVFPLAPETQFKFVCEFNARKTIEDTENLDLLALCVFAAIESKNIAVLTYIKEQRQHTFIPALKIAIQKALVANRQEFFDVLFSPSFKKHLTSGALANLILSPNNPILSSFVLSQMNIGFFERKHILAAVQSAVDSADYSPQAGAYLTELLKSAHNTCTQEDYVEIFTKSCKKNSPDNQEGLRALSRYLTPQSATDVFCSVVNMEPEIVQKVLPIIFSERGHDMYTEAVIQRINGGDALVRSAAESHPALWARIPHLAQASAVAVLAVEA